MTDRSVRDRIFWGVGIFVVVVYALVPVAWIVSLSLKPEAELTDWRFIPDTVTLDNYRNIFDDVGRQVAAPRPAARTG